MAQLIVRNIEDDVVEALRRRAAANGRSAEAEHREILRRALRPVPPGRSFKDLLAQMPDVGEDADFAPRRGPGRDVAL
jgi:plasmid stability protein